MQKGAVDIAGDVSVGEIRFEGVHPVLNPGGDGDPDAVLGVTKNEVDFADSLAIDTVGKHSGFAAAGHHLQAIGAKVGDEKVAVTSEGEPVGKRTRQISRGFAVGFRMKWPESF